MLTWQNAAGLNLHVNHWPIESPRAVIALVHGHGEHTGRYGHFAAWYNAHGVAVIGYDQQGHGKTEGPRGHAKNADAMVDDIGLLLRETRQRYPGVPVFLYGHSMGGCLSLTYTLRHKPVIAGLIVTGPQIRLAFQPSPLKITAGKWLRSIVPTLALATGLPVKNLSQDPAVVQAYINDPLVHDKLSAAAGISILETAAWLNTYKGVTNIPMLLQHGEADLVTSAPATKELADRLNGDVTYYGWPGLYHEIHNEPSQKEIFAATLAWMEPRLRNRL